MIIQAHQLGKQYRLGALQPRNYKTLRESLIDWGKRPFRTLTSRQSTRAQQNASFWALRDVSFEVTAGEVVGIIGRNGAGKSTLLKILSRITEPTSGYADIYGRVGSLLEVGTGFHPELTGRENIFLNGAILGMKRREISAKFDEIVAFAEVERFIDTPVKHYSSGMYLRLAFAVAAHLEPEILLVDEVLAVGDAAFQKKCLGKMGDVAKAGRTVLFVSHNMAAVQQLCQRAILLDGGRVVRDAVAPEVIRDYLQTAADSGLVRFDEETVRRGNGRSRYQQATIFNDHGEIASSIQAGSNLKIELAFHHHGQPLSNPSFGVSFRNTFGQPITRLITRETHGEMPTVNGDGRVCLAIDNVNLLPGLYYLTLGLSNQGEQLDLIEDGLQLEVTSAPVYPTGKLPPAHAGVVYLPCRWEHDYE